MLIKESGGYSVSYRGTRYHADEVSHVDEPSPLTLAFSGMCECAEKPSAETDNTPSQYESLAGGK